MKRLDAKNYHRIPVGTHLLVAPTGDKPCAAKLLYLYARKNYLYDKQGNITEEFEMVNHRVGFMPLSGLYDGQRVDSVHCSVGLFEVYLYEVAP